jgi:hypothetical protein
MDKKGVGIATVAAGSVFAYAGIRGYSPLKAIQNILIGQPPNANQKIGLLAGAGGNGSGGTPATDSALANIAIADIGHAYLYGGAPGTDGKHPWDCSSACNWWIGHEAGLSIPMYPNGSYTGASHGPPTGAWLLWNGVANIHRSQIQAGDIMVWQTHMGIAISNTEMVSAIGHAEGTRRGAIAGPTGEVLIPKRMKYPGHGPGPRPA